MQISLVLACFIVISNVATPKILHLSFHKGCINDFEHAAQASGVQVTSWFIVENREALQRFDDQSSGNAIYNIGHERAARIWKKHKNYFDSFDAIIVSDTAPLSRIFLQNGWKKPLIIWICNRFDYYDGASLDCDFPDQEYYDLFAKAITQSNVRIISYTPYEYHYARKKGIHMGDFTIKPLGLPCQTASFISSIPASLSKSDTLFIPPYLTDQEKAFLLDRCQELHIPVFCGRYNGPCDLKDFKGIIHFPYQFSNLALFENIHQGLVYFVPTLRFINELVHEQHVPIRYISSVDVEWAEWYRPENKELFVYFDSWQDLNEKVEKTNYLAKMETIRTFAHNHRKIMLERWKSIFDYFNL